MGAVYAGDAKAFFPVWRFPDGSNPRSYEAGSTRSLGHLTRCRRTRPRTAGRPSRSARTARGAADRAPGERGLAGRERLIARGERDGGALRHRKPAAAAGPTGAALESAPAASNRGPRQAPPRPCAGPKPRRHHGRDADASRRRRRQGFSTPPRGGFPLSPRPLHVATLFLAEEGDRRRSGEAALSAQ